MEAYERAQLDRVSARSRPLAGPSSRDERDRAVTRATGQDMEVPILVLRLPGVQARTGLSPSTIYVQVAAESFPKPVCAVGWIEKEVDAWIRQQTTARRGWGSTSGAFRST